MDSSIQSAGDMAAMQPVPHLAKIGKGGNVDKTSKDFESMFMSQMLQPMFEGMGTDPVFGGGNGEKVMRSFLVQEYGKLVGQKTNLGIADAVKKEMIRAQGGDVSQANNGVQNATAN